MWHFANGKSDRHDEVKRLMDAVSREKKFAKPLDKPLEVWYNVSTVREGKPLENQKGIDTMANTKKMTKAQMFAQIKANHNLSADEIAFIDHELELLAKKNSAEKKPTAQQTANEGIKTAIAEGMEPNRLYTVTEIQKEIPECAELSNQRVSALLRQMKDDGIVVRTEDKRKAYFSLVK